MTPARTSVARKPQPSSRSIPGVARIILSHCSRRSNAVFKPSGKRLPSHKRMILHAIQAKMQFLDAPQSGRSLQGISGNRRDCGCVSLIHVAQSIEFCDNSHHLPPCAVTGRKRLTASRFPSGLAKTAGPPLHPRHHDRRAHAHRAARIFHCHASIEYTNGLRWLAARSPGRSPGSQVSRST